MKTLRKNGGFTLVELIVVIAILAILAGVAVPAYSGYIKKANDAAVVTQLDAIKTAVFAANATKSDEITKIEITPGSGSAAPILTVSPSGLSKDIDDFYTLSDLKLANTSYAAGAEWENGTWSAKQ